MRIIMNAARTLHDTFPTSGQGDSKLHKWCMGEGLTASSPEGTDQQVYSPSVLERWILQFKEWAMPYGYLLVAQYCLNVPVALIEQCLENFAQLGGHTRWNKTFMCTNFIVHGRNFSSEFVERLCSYGEIYNLGAETMVRQDHEYPLDLLREQLIRRTKWRYQEKMMGLRQYFAAHPEVAMDDLLNPSAYDSEEKLETVTEFLYSILSPEALEKWPLLFPESWKASEAYSHCQTRKDIEEYLAQ